MKIILFFLLLTSVYSCAQDKPARITYAIKGTDTLWMDHYTPAGKANGMSVLFIHGGAFVGGHPDGQRSFAEKMRKNGYNVFVMSYRLFLKGKDFGCNTVTPVKLQAIRTAVEDAADATKYIAEHAAALQTDTSKLFIGGSSAGAETLLHLLFNPFAGSDSSRYNFFRHYRFRGALVFAGALVDMNPLTQENWIPMLLMHGTGDKLVPYGTAAHHYCKATDAGWLMMFGAKTIYDTGIKWKKPVVLYSYDGKGHEVSGYMVREFDKIDGFMKAAVNGKVESKHVEL